MKKSKRKKRIGKIVTGAFALAGVFFCSMQSVFAADIARSKIATGTEALISDLTTWLMILAPVASGALIIYFFIRRSAADEMDTRKWNNRITTAIISCIGAVLGSVLLNLIIGYYM